MTALKRGLFIHATTAFLLCAIAANAHASELYGLGGAVRASNPSDNSYSWQLEYRQDLLKHLAAGVSYLNEGHIKSHHRDGYSPQLWVRSELFAYRLTVAAAVGPYFYLDTASSMRPPGFENDHGFKALFSVAAAWHFQNDLIFEMRSNWVRGGSGFDTASVLAGIGYHFDPNLEPQKGKGLDHEALNEVTAFFGRSIANSYNSEQALAGSLEYRRRLLRHLEWSAGAIYEGNDKLTRRAGLVTQAWANQDLLEGLLTAGVGLGPYVSVSQYHNRSQAEDDQRISAMLTVSGSYRFAQHFDARISWNRLITNNSRDSDIIFGGLGYRF